MPGVCSCPGCVAIKKMEIKSYKEVTDEKGKQNIICNIFFIVCQLLFNSNLKKKCFTNTDLALILELVIALSVFFFVKLINWYQGFSLYL